VADIIYLLIMILHKKLHAKQESEHIRQ
jgi:hypothetical protein